MIHQSNNDDESVAGGPWHIRMRVNIHADCPGEFQLRTGFDPEKGAIATTFVNNSALPWQPAAATLADGSSMGIRPLRFTPSRAIEGSTQTPMIEWPNSSKDTSSQTSRQTSQSNDKPWHHHRHHRCHHKHHNSDSDGRRTRSSHRSHDHHKHRSHSHRERKQPNDYSEVESIRKHKSGQSSTSGGVKHSRNSRAVQTRSASPTSLSSTSISPSTTSESSSCRLQRSRTTSTLPDLLTDKLHRLGLDGAEIDLDISYHSDLMQPPGPIPRSRTLPSVVGTSGFGGGRTGKFSFGEPSFDCVNWLKQNIDISKARDHLARSNSNINEETFDAVDWINQNLSSLIGLTGSHFYTGSKSEPNLTRSHTPFVYEPDTDDERPETSNFAVQTEFSTTSNSSSRYSSSTLTTTEETSTSRNTLASEDQGPLRGLLQNGDSNSLLALGQTFQFVLQKLAADVSQRLAERNASGNASSGGSTPRVRSPTQTAELANTRGFRQGTGVSPTNKPFGNRSLEEVCNAIYEACAAVEDVAPIPKPRSRSSTQSKDSQHQAELLEDESRVAQLVLSNQTANFNVGSKANLVTSAQSSEPPPPPLPPRAPSQTSYETTLPVYEQVPLSFRAAASKLDSGQHAQQRGKVEYRNPFEIFGEQSSESQSNNNNESSLRTLNVPITKELLPTQKMKSPTNENLEAERLRMKTLIAANAQRLTPPVSLFSTVAPKRTVVESTTITTTKETTKTVHRIPSPARKSTQNDEDFPPPPPPHFDQGTSDFPSNGAIQRNQTQQQQQQDFLAKTSKVVKPSAAPPLPPLPLKGFDRSSLDNFQNKQAVSIPSRYANLASIDHEGDIYEIPAYRTENKGETKTPPAVSLFVNTGASSAQKNGQLERSMSPGNAGTSPTPSDQESRAQRLQSSSSSKIFELYTNSQILPPKQQQQPPPPQVPKQTAPTRPTNDAQRYWRPLQQQLSVIPELSTPESSTNGSSTRSQGSASPTSSLSSFGRCGIPLMNDDESLAYDPNMLLNLRNLQKRSQSTSSIASENSSLSRQMQKGAFTVHELNRTDAEDLSDYLNSDRLTPLADLDSSSTTISRDSVVSDASIRNDKSHPYFDVDYPQRQNVSRNTQKGIQQTAL